MKLRAALAELSAYTPPRVVPATKLDANESPWPLPAEVRTRIASVLAELPLHRYPDARAEGLRTALASHLGCDADELVLGTGSDEIISILYTALGSGSVVVPAPTFVMYRVSALTHGLSPVEVPLTEDWSLDVDAMKQALAARPAIVFYARPNNPTGAVIPENVLRDLITFSPDTLHIIDEAYVAFHRDTPGDAPGSLGTWCTQHENVAVMGTLSKIGLAGLRVGWLRAAPSLAAELDKVRQPFNLNLLAQEAARVILAEFPHVIGEQIRAIVKERELLRDSLDAHPAIRHVWPSRANFLLVQTVDDASAVAHRLREKNVGVRAFRDERLAQLLRVTVGTPAERELLLSALS
ncbi:MAG: histidinol-phosphate transaminase [Myxococcota bacterium]